jgi:hypothetical protein
MTTRTVRFACLSLLLLTACGGSTLASQCKRTVQVPCKKLFACTPEVAAAQGFTSEADCATKGTAQLDCARFDTINCSGVDYAPLDRCLSDYESQACNATSQPASCQNLGNPTTGATCTSSDGRIVCTSGSASASAGGCSSTRTGCGDKKTYELACTNGTCTCSVDGAMTKTYSGTSCSDQAAINTGCGWNLL